ncbi:hypothetical protein [Pontibacillus sp. HMF3514]|uniref:hypothetical protein n=1 Tax=Pontibacillus sp. HMF3514 TaxID=2692425 RepID=UPI00131F4E08|nr:hypothetical protein [Pontibacillus sp. HMF3514]QHE53777.1 hypothetical protein GS400_17905 [Pontibacillus sp. HMF3514]
MKRLMLMGMTLLMALGLFVGGFNVISVQAAEGPQFHDPAEPPLPAVSNADPGKPQLPKVSNSDPVEPPLPLYYDPVEPPLP